MCSISADGDLADLIRETKLIIWDEAPMVNRLCFEAFDRTLRDISTGKFYIICFAIYLHVFSMCNTLVKKFLLLILNIFIFFCCS